MLQMTNTGNVTDLYLTWSSLKRFNKGTWLEVFTMRNRVYVSAFQVDVSAAISAIVLKIKLLKSVAQEVGKSNASMNLTSF